MWSCWSLCLVILLSSVVLSGFLLGVRVVLVRLFVGREVVVGVGKMGRMYYWVKGRLGIGFFILSWVRWLGWGFLGCIFWKFCGVNGRYFLSVGLVFFELDYFCWGLRVEL